MKTLLCLSALVLAPTCKLTIARECWRAGQRACEKEPMIPLSRATEPQTQRCMGLMDRRFPLPEVCGHCWRSSTQGS
eukprot:1513359-Alexandrium_andersonii.AAC.1